MGPDFFQWCPVTGHGAMGRNWKFHLILRKKIFTLRLTGRALEQAAHRGYGVSFCGDIQNLPVQPALNEPALAGGLGRWCPEVPSNPSFGDSVWTMHCLPCNVEVCLKASLFLHLVCRPVFIKAEKSPTPPSCFFFPGRCVLLCKKSAPSVAMTGVLCQGDRSCPEQFLGCERARLLQHSICKLMGQEAESHQLPLTLEKWGCSQSFTDTKHIADFRMWGLKANESITRSLAASLRDSSGWTQRSWVLDGNWIFINSCESVLKQLGHINEFFCYEGRTRYCRDLLPASVWCMRK